MYPTAAGLDFCVRLSGDEKEFPQNNTVSVLYQYVNMTDMTGGTTAFFLPLLATDDMATS